MAKITVTLTSQYDDGKAVKEPGETISIEEKQAKQLAALGMVTLPVKETKAKAKSKTAKTPVDDDPDPIGGDDLDGLDPDNLDPDQLGDE